MSKIKKSTILALAKKQIKTVEKPKNSNNVKYNTWYYGKAVNGVNYSWCCVFICWLFAANKALDMIGNEKIAYVPTLDHALQDETKTIYHHGTGSISSGQPGDIIIYDWSGKHVSSDHVGIIEKKSSNGSYTTIEGNTSSGANGSQSNGDGVYRRIRSQYYISAIFRPSYLPEKTTSKYKGTLPKLPKRGYFIAGDHGLQVKLLQKFLNWAVSAGLAVDGIVGNATMSAVGKFQDKVKIFKNKRFDKGSLAKAKTFKK